LESGSFTKAAFLNPAWANKDVQEALPYLLAVRTTREYLAEWTSGRTTIEEALAKAKAHLEATGTRPIGA
jgi:hypothetical protein